MKILSSVKKVINVTCLSFTLMMISFQGFLALAGIGDNGSKISNGQVLTRLLILLLFSFIIGAASLIFDIKKLHIALRIIADFIIDYAGMYLCVFVIFVEKSGMDLYGMEGYNSQSYTSASVVVATVVFIVIYAAVVAIKLITEHISAKRKKSVPYTRQFSELSDKKD